MAIESESDETLVRRIRDGEQELSPCWSTGTSVASQTSSARAFAAPRMCRTSRRRRSCEHTRTSTPSIRNSGRFSTWIYQIARNVVRTHLGKSLRRPAPQELPEDQTLENALPDPSAESDPAGGVLRAEAESELRAALAELPERTRTVLALRYFDNMEYHTIASTLGLSLGNVKTLIHRGKIALAKKMQERDARQRSSAARERRTRALLLV